MTRNSICYSLFIGTASFGFRSFLHRVIRGEMERIHRPVMVSEVIEFIRLTNGGTYADLTFGEGGHSTFFLKEPIASLFATDRDPTAVSNARTLKQWSEEPRLKLFHADFSQFPEIVGSQRFDGILIDLGVSTRQLLEGDRGFSLFADGPLDMRMNTGMGPTLEEILHTINETDLANAIYRYTDNAKSRSIAKRVMENFKSGKIQKTSDLAKLMGPVRPGKSHPATSLFLALRMLVNQEIEQIEQTLPSLIPLLKPGGRLVVLTFHSTEDRCVKNLFRLLAGRCICEKDICSCPREKRVNLITPKPIVPTDAEIRQNPRARSTKLRAVEKI